MDVSIIRSLQRTLIIECVYICTETYTSYFEECFMWNVLKREKRNCSQEAVNKNFNKQQF